MVFNKVLVLFIYPKDSVIFYINILYLYYII